MFVVGNGRSIPTLNTNERKSGSETRIKPSYDLKPTNRFSHTVALYLCLKPYLVCRNYTSIFRNMLLFTSPISKYVLTASPSNLTLSRHFKICLKDFLVTFILPILIRISLWFASQLFVQDATSITLHAHNLTVAGEISLH